MEGLTEKYRDVPIDCFDTASFYSVTIGNNQDIDKVEENRAKGGGFYYKDQVYQNRFILWRTISREFELLELSYEQTLTNNAVRYSLPNNLIGIPYFLEYDSTNNKKKTMVYLLTEDNCLYQFTFNHPDSLNSGVSILSDKKPIKFEGVGKRNEIKCFTVVNKHTIIFGCANGSLVFCRIIGRDYEETETKTTGLFSSLWQRFSSAGVGAGVISMQNKVIKNQEYIFTVSTDNKLRIWQGKAMIQMHELPFSQDDELSESTISNLDIQIDENPKNSSITILIKIDSIELSSKITQFYLFSFFYDNLNFRYLYCISPPEMDVYEFLLSKNKLFVSGKLNVRENNNLIMFSTQYCDLIDSESGIKSISSWKSIFSQHFSYLMEDEILENFPDIKNAFLSRIFAANRFSDELIYESIKDEFNIQVLEESSPQFSSSLSINSNSHFLRSFLMETLEKHKKPNESAFILWKKLLENCENYWRDLSYPVGLFIHPFNNISVVLSKNQCFFLRKSTILEEIHEIFSNFSEFNKNLIQLNLPEPKSMSNLDEMKIQVPSVAFEEKEFVKFIELIQFLISTIGENELKQIDDDLYHKLDLQLIFQQHIENLFFSQSQSVPIQKKSKNNIENLENESTNSHFQLIADKFIQLFNQIPNIVDFIKYFLDLLSDPLQFVNNGSSQSPRRPLYPNLDPLNDDEQESSELWKDLLAVSIQQCSHSYFIISRNFNLFLFFLLRIRHSIYLSSDELNYLQSVILPYSCDLLKIYFSIEWFTQQRLYNTPSSSLSSPSSPFTYTIRSFIDSVTLSASSQPRIPRHPANFQDYLFHLFSILFQSSNSPSQQHGSTERNEIAKYLDEKQEYMLLQQFIHLQNNENSRELNYYQGKVYLYFEQFEKAADSFHKSAFALLSNQSQLKQGNGAMGEENDEMNELADYYDGIQDLFHHFSPNEQVLQFAYASLQLPIDSLRKSRCWKRIFHCSLEQNDFQQAYVAMLHCQIDKLSIIYDLVCKLCESGRLDLLCDDKLSFPWSGVVQLPVQSGNSSYRPSNSLLPSPNSSPDEYEMNGGANTGVSSGNFKQSISLIDIVDDILQSKAREMDNLSSVNYYQILFSFHVFRCNFIKAGQAMIDYAARIKNDQRISFIERLDKQIHAYLSCLHLFRLIHQNFTWIENSSNLPNLSFDSSSGSSLHSNSFQSFNERRFNPSASPKRTRDGEIFNKQEFSVPRTIVTLQDIEKRFVSLSSLRALAADSSFRNYLSDEELISSLINATFFDKAVTLALLGDSALQRFAFTCLFVKLTSSVLDFIQRSQNTITSGYEYNLQIKWNHLKEYLEKYDKNKNCDYYVISAEEVVKRNFSIPNWITSHVRENNPGALLRLLLSYKRFEEAISVVHFLFRNVVYTLKDKKDIRQQLCLPYTQIDQLLSIQSPDWKDKILRLKAEYTKIYDEFRDALVHPLEVSEEDLSEEGEMDSF